MKIIHLSSEYPPASVYGLGRYVQGLAEAQASLGHSVEVYTNSFGGDEHELLRNGVTIKRVRFPPPPRASTTSAMILHFNLQLVERIVIDRMDSAEPRVEVINAHDWLTVPAAIHLSRVLKCPMVTTFHDIILHKTRNRTFTAEDAYVAGVENWATHCSNKLIVLSESVRTEVVSSYKGRKQNIDVIAAGVNLTSLKDSDFAQISGWREKIVQADEDLLLYAGRLDAEKGLFILLDAITKLSKRRPSGWRLVLAGNGHLHQKIDSVIRSHGLHKHVIQLGYLAYSELLFAYTAADVVIVPSEYEPFGLVALESQSAGTPVIVSDVGGLGETIRKTGGGLTFPVGNSDSLLNCIDQLLSSVSKRKELGQLGQQNVRRLFSWGELARQVVAAYASVLGKVAIDMRKPEIPQSDSSKPMVDVSSVYKRAPIFEDMSVDSYQGQINNIVIFWHRQKMPALKPLLEKFLQSHALNILQGLMYVIPVSEIAEDTRAWNVPIDDPRIKYMQPDNPSILYPRAAAVFADAELSSALKESGMLDSRSIPTVWIGLDIVDDGWCVTQINELYALFNKLLCDERLRNILAPDIKHPILQLSQQPRSKSVVAVLHVLPQLVTGGAESTLLEIVKGSVETIKHSILCLGPLEGPIPDELVQAGAEFVNLNTDIKDGILSALRKHAPDILHLHSMSYVSEWIPVHRHLAEWNIVETEQVVNIGAGHFGPVDKVVCVSNVTRDAHRPFEDAWREGGPDFNVIYNGIDSNAFASLPDKREARRILGLPYDRPIVGRVSALARNKLPHEALDVIPLVLRRRPDALFVIVGDGPQRASAEAWVAEHRLQHAVCFLGERRDIPVVLRAFDVFAYYTVKDSLGIVILEAVAAGVPVVTTNVEGTPEALADAPGSLVPLGDLNHFADEVAKWLNYDTKPLNYVLSEHFTRQGMIDRYLKTYNQLVNSTTNKFSPDTMEKVTILIPLYNVKFEWLVEALQSIKRQTYDCWEIILVNDGNSVQVTNDIHKIIYSDGALNRRAKIIDLDTNGGIANALNIGLAACETELVARLDADDRMHPQRLARQVAKMRCAPEISVLGGFALLIDTNGNFIKEKVNQLIYPIHHTAILNAFQSFCSIAHPAVMYRKEHVLKAGGYDCSAKYFEDYDLWIRMASMNFRFHNLPSMMIDYRIHDNSVSKVFEIEQAKGMRSCMDKATRMKFHKIEMA